MCYQKSSSPAIGREQANATGLRLAELAEPYSHCVISTMTRANETGEIILKHMPIGEKFAYIKRTKLQFKYYLCCRF